MANYYKGAALRDTIVGMRVIKTAQLQPQTATATLFTISGGNVLITALYGQVVVLTPATTNTLALGLTPTTGTASTTSIATAVSTASLEAGTYLSAAASGSKGGALLVGTNASTVIYAQLPFIAPAGALTWTTSGSAATGTIAWYCTYLPLDDGASVS